MANDSRKDDLKKAWKQQERARLVASMPLAPQDLRDLLDHLDREDAPPCDHTLREAVEFLEKRELDVERVVAWLHEHGGYCDCEVIYNVGDTFGPIVGRQ